MSRILFIFRVSSSSIIRVLGNYYSFSSRSKLAKIVSKIPKSFVYLSYSGAKNIFRLPNISQFSQAILSKHQSLPFNHYLQILSSSKASIAPVGNGYNTSRYWEISLCGTTLIAQKPIHDNS